jgi:hypothetical protein
MVVIVYTNREFFQAKLILTARRHLDSLCPGRPATIIGMKLNQVFSGLAGNGEIIAYFGQARLIKRLDSKFELRGGSAEDHCAAREWISLFMHEVVLAPGPPALCERSNRASAPGLRQTCPGNG